MNNFNSEDYKPGFISKNMAPILFLIFLVLKLTKQIDWSWWWVTSPLWIIFLILFILIAISQISLFVIKIVKKLRKDNQNMD
jgi:hypothetical protein